MIEKTLFNQANHIDYALRKCYTKFHSEFFAFAAEFDEVFQLFYLAQFKNRNLPWFVDYESLIIFEVGSLSDFCEKGTNGEFRLKDSPSDRYTEEEYSRLLGENEKWIEVNLKDLVKANGSDAQYKYSDGEAFYVKANEYQSSKDRLGHRHFRML
jgi:hypothetical protein